MLKALPFLIFALTLGLLGCLQTENTNSLDEKTYGEIPGTPEYKAARAIFKTSCSAPCHTHAFHTRTEAELVADGYAIPGNALASPIYNYINGASGSGPRSMPPTGALTTEEIATIENWILSIQ